MIELVKPPFQLFMEGVDEAFMQAAIGKDDEEFKWELGGVGRLYIEKDGTLTLGEPILLKQTVTAGSCEFHNHITEWLKTWAPEACEAAMPNVNFYTWHSHNSMDTFRSHQDDEWIGNYVNSGLLVTLIGNHKGSWKAYIDTVSKHGDEYMHHQLPCKLHILHQPRPDYVAAAKVAVEQRASLVELPSATSMLLAAARDARGRFVGHGANLTEPLDQELEDYYLGRDGHDDTLKDVPAFVSPSSASSFNKRLPYNRTVGDLALAHGISLRIYFAKADKPPYLVCFMCNSRTMYTVDIGGPILNQIRLVFRISKKQLRKFIGSGKAINYVVLPADDKRPRWKLHDLQGTGVALVSTDIIGAS